MAEIWKSLDGIIDCGGNYIVSTYGNVKNATAGNDLSLQVSPHGYNRAMLHNGKNRKNVFVHRLVALAFIPNPDNKPQVNHKDGNKLNNKVSNLEWVTPSENIQHAYDSELRAIKLGSEVNNATLTEDIVKLIKADLINCSSTAILAEKYNVSSSAISDIKVGITWSHVEVEGFTPYKTTVNGSNNGKSRLTEDDVRLIKKLHRDKKFKQVELSKMFNVSKHAISDIIRGRTWKHVV
ncbi:HNH endonuclease [Bacillus phage Chotacabras]|nr:HNH endonuclease [Bacillus phage Chotacabras]